MIEKLQGGNPAIQSYNSMNGTENIKSLCLPYIEYCIESSTSAGWEQTYACNGVRL